MTARRGQPFWLAPLRNPLSALGVAAVGLVIGLLWDAGQGMLLHSGSEAKANSTAAIEPEAPSNGGAGATDGMGASTGAKRPAPSSALTIKGPAVDVPKEVLNMLDQRKRFLDQREDALRAERARLDTLKQDLELLLDRYEASVKAYEEEQEKQRAAKVADEEAAKKRREAAAAARQQSFDTVTKIYEAMPSEEAAERIEKMPVPLAVNVLGSLKSKTAGAILANVSVGKAARLSEQLSKLPQKTPPKAPDKKK